MEQEEIDLKYRKWLTGFRINDAVLYSIWGEDTTGDHEDKLWVDADLRIIVFKDALQAVKTASNSSLPLFDADKLRNWAVSVTKFGHSIEAQYVHDLDKITDQVKRIDFINLGANDPDFTFELINFINLFGDYVLQIKDEDAIKTWRNPSLSQFWEYMYNAYFWTISSEELTLKQEELLRDYDAQDCEQSLTKTLYLFKDRLQLYN